MHVNHKKNKVFPRGSNFFNVPEISKETGVGVNTVYNSIEWLKKARQITTQKTTRGIVVNVLQYDKYQDPVSYKGETDYDTKGEISTKQVRNGYDTINNNEKNERMKEDNYREGGEENKNTLSVDKPPTRTGISFHSFEKSIHAKDEMYVFIVERCRAHYKFDTFIVERELQKFYDYWTEKSPTAKKSRWEKETVFDVNRRIATWMSRVSLSEKDLEEIEKAKVLRKLAQSEKLLNEQKI